MEAKLLGKCGFYCEACPTYMIENCKGCVDEHIEGDCFTRDCVMRNGLEFCGQCVNFPCNEILEKPHSTVLDKEWLVWKKRSNTNQ